MPAELLTRTPSVTLVPVTVEAVAQVITYIQVSSFPGAPQVPLESVVCPGSEFRFLFEHTVARLFYRKITLNIIW